MPAEEAKRKGRSVAKGMKGPNLPFLQLSELKEVFNLFATMKALKPGEKKEKRVELDEVPYVLRAMGLTIYGEEEATIKAAVEKIDGLGKPVSLKTMQDWCEENQKFYMRSEGDAYDAIYTLCHEGVIGPAKSEVIDVKALRHLVGEVGDKIKPEEFDKIVTDLNPNIPLEEFMTWLKK
mmetsp:Transcript_78887/g.124560  ORF Transcript_78887/g.124560 Transcript_78887/m.124560 type:complete len:179 (-) Transcript_78887:120-656(-)|eukprot:CAMPEP_0169119920 /NCGR_PEP_ID=MMETSP1015-20121227/31822_1 /TAXON_ID=342587 /ORGANISM="Karlodinium micrum, Strain CCMP2283" /LENGTH=178 /DNA_ID=CAMNT_0009182849 /DNA_START=69 /DNA_END=605 /DNA_ORIENTATION=-